MSEIAALLKENEEQLGTQQTDGSAVLVEETTETPAETTETPQPEAPIQLAESSGSIPDLIIENEQALRRGETSIKAGRALGGDRAAEVLDLSKRSGLDRDLVQRNLDEVRQRQTETDLEIEDRKVTKSAPGTAAWVSKDEYNAALADGDFGILSEIEDGIVGGAKAIFSEDTLNSIVRQLWYQGRLGLFNILVRSPLESYEAEDKRNQALAEAAEKPDASLDTKIASFIANNLTVPSPYELMVEGTTTVTRNIEEAFTGRPDQSNVDYARDTANALDKRRKELQNMAEPGTPAYYIPEIIGGAASQAPTVALRVIGGPVYGTGLALTELAARVYGNAYQEGIEDKKLPQNTAALRAAFQAGFEALTEKLPLDKIVEPIVKSGKRQLTKRASNILAASGLEGFQEGLVTIMNTAYDMGVLGEDVDPKEAFSKVVDSVIIGAGSGGLTSTGTNIVGSVLDRRRATANRERVVGQLERARESVLRNRSPEHFEEYFQTLADQNDSSSISIDAAPVVEYLTEQGENPAEFFQMLGVPEEDVRNAFENGTDVSVQAGTFFTMMPDNPYREMILMNTREADNAPTMAEAEIRTEQMRERLDQAYEELSSEDRIEVEDAAKRLRNQFVEDAVAAGRPRSDALNAAAVYEAYFRTTLDAYVNDPNRDENSRPISEIVNELERDVFNIRTRSVPFAERGQPLETESELEQTLRRTGRLKITPAEQTFFDEIFDDQNTLDELLEVVPSLTVEDGVMSIAENDIDALMNKMLDFQASDGASSLPPRFRATTAYARSFAGRMAFEQTVDPTSENFRNWFRDSAVVDENGEPLVVYRGEHGEVTGDVTTMLPSITFSNSPEVASQYAEDPNDSRMEAVAPRVSPAYLSIKQPVINTPGDPYIDLDTLINAIGYEATIDAVRRAGTEQIEDSNAWFENFANEFESFEDVVERAPERLMQAPSLPILAFRVLDDPATVEALKAAGYDGAIHGGFGTAVDDVEYRVFDQTQIKSQFNQGTFDPADPNILNQTVDPTSENFRNWFRESVVVDENGEPRVVYHGTNAVIYSFDPEMLGSKNWMADSAREGFFFAGSPDTSEYYTGLDTMQSTGLATFDEEARKLLEPFQPEQDAIDADRNAVYAKALEDLRATERYQQALATFFDDVESIDFNTDEMQAFLRSIDENVAQAEYGVSLFDYTNQLLEDSDLNERQEALNRDSYAVLQDYGIEKLGLQPNIMPVYLSIQNPLIVDMSDVAKSTEGLTQNIQLAKRDGHDGVIFKNLQDGGPAADDIFVVFDPTQIKSQFNQGTFDPDDPRILFQNKYNPPPQPAVAPQNYKLTKADRDNVKKLKASNPKLSRLASSLTEEEQSALTPAITKHFVENYEKFPSPAETAAVALSGRAKRGWYANSVRAVETIFGEDAPRFVALLAGTSPQTSVESNTINTLMIWKNWIAAGRPQDPDTILKIMGDSVQGDKGEDSVLGAWINNSVGALMAEDPEAYVLSGPKVNSFALNLRGFLDEVTNDTWMANFANSEQELFGKTGNRLPGKGGGYLAMNAVARGAAKKLTTDDDQWRGAEIQETVWSWAKALLEKANSAGETRSALKILTDGDLTHEMVNDVPDFEKLFLQSPYRSVLEEAGYGEQLAQVQQSVDTRLASEQPLTGSVYDGLNEKTQANLRRAARRLDALRARRAFEKQTAEILVNLSAATGTIPGLDQLQKAANDGDASANVALQEVARNSLTYLFDGIDSAEVEFTPAGGLYFGELEPSLGLKVTFQERDRPKALGALAKFAENFNQEQVHVRAAPVARNRAKIGKVFDDGSYNTHMVRFELASPLTREEVQDVIDKSGLVGLTITDQYLEAYHVGDPNDGEGFNEFEESIIRAAASLGDRSRSVNESVARLWAYGEGYGATDGYDSIQRQLRPAKTEKANPTAVMIASRVAGFNVKGTEPAKETTPEQADLQREIADAFDQLEMNRLDDPDVARAYTELAEEVARQYDAMPIKVEVWTGKGEPYPGKKMSKKMRDDVLLNNHLYIYKTELDQFGPPGQSYEGHSIHVDSGRVDMNGEPLVFNDLLRAVHDYYAHTITPGTFGPRGEEAAWKNHMEMTTSPWARWALTTETRGQNSWVNFRAEAEGKTLAERGFSEQKVGLLPLEFVMTGNGLVDSSLGQLPGSEGLNLEMPPQTPELYSDPKDPLGSFDPVRRVINLFEEADYSTLLHESGHAFVHILEEISDRPDAPQRIKDNYQAILDWVGARSAADMDVMIKGEPAREKQERLARAFEAYLREGKAPSTRLQSAFDQFKFWLKQIYENLLELNVRMDKDITRVFDRMLATDAEIAQIEAVNEFTIEDSPSILSLLDADQRVAAQDLQLQARDRVREMRNIEEERHAARLASQEYNEERAVVSLETRAEIEAEQNFRAHIFLTTGEFNDRETPEALQGRRISRKAMLDAGYTKEQLEAIPRASDNGKSGKAVYSSNEEDATDPEFLAGFLGYDSGAELMAAMIDLPAREDEINRRTDAIMGDRPQYRDPARDGTLLELSKEFAYNAEQAKLIDLQLDALAQKAGMERDSRAFVQAVADRMFREEPVGDMLSPTKFAAASRRAARRAEQAAAREDYQKALLEKRKEQLNFELHRRAIRAKKEVGSINKRLKFLKTKKYSPKEIDPLYSSEMQMILQFYEFGDRSKSDTIDPAAAQRVADFITARQAEGANLILPGDLIEVASIDPETQTPRFRFKKKFWKEMTLAELRALRDMAENLRKIGADQSSEAKAAKKKFHEELADNIRSSTARRTKGRDPMKPQPHDKLKKLFNKGSFAALHRKMESILLQLDGFKTLGPMYQAVFNGLSDASDTKAALVTEVMRRMKENFQIYDDDDRKNFSNDKGRVAIPSLNNAEWTREDRVVLALNWGNETSREAVLEDQSKINDYGQAWNETTINEILATLDNKDLDFIEATWALIDSFWEDYTLSSGRVVQGIKSLETETAGFAPPKIDPDPFFVNGRMMSGGYYPLMYDPLSDQRSAKESEAELKKRLESGGFARAATSHGFTNARVGSGGRAVRRDLSALNRHLDEVTQDLSYRKAIQQATEVLGSNEVRAAIEETMGDPYRAALDDILVYTATGGVATNDLGAIDSFLSSARINVTIGIMGLNLRSILTQPLGLLQSIERLGVKNVANGVAWFWKRPHHIPQRIKQIHEMSPYMAERSNTMTRELDDLSNQIQNKTNLKNIKEFGFKPMVFVDVVSVAYPTWWGSYSAAMDGRIDNIDAGDEAAAIRFADMQVRTTQGSGGAQNLSKVQQMNELMKLMTMFYGYFNTTYNLQAEAYQKARADGSSVPRALLKKEFIGSTILLQTIPAILADLLLEKWPDPEEEDEDPFYAWSKWTVVSIAKYSSAQLVGVRDVVSAAISGFDLSITPALAPGQGFGQLLNMLARPIQTAGTDGLEFAMEEAKEIFVSPRFYKKLVFTAGTAAGIPGTNTIARTGDYLYKFSTDELKKPPRNVAEFAQGVLLTGDR